MSSTSSCCRSATPPRSSPTQLEAEGWADVRVVREALAGEDDSEAHEWAVHVRTPPDPAYAASFQALAAAHDGWYDPDPLV